MGVRFSSTLLGTNIALSSNDTVATGNASTVDQNVMCLPGVNPWNNTNAQKVYIEFQVTTGDAGAGHMAIGMQKAVDTITWLGAPGRDSFGYWSDGTVIVNTATLFTGPTWTTGDRIQIAWDNVTARAWVRKNGGAWANSGDPVALTGGIQMDAAAANAIRNFAVEPGDSGTFGAIQLKSRRSEWSGTPPTGYGELADGVVQIKAGGSALATTTPTLDYPITAGNHLVYAIMSGGYLSATPTGFTLETNAAFQSGSGANSGMAVYRKQATGSDTFQHVQSGAFSSVWAIAELENIDTSTPFNGAASNYINNSAGITAASQAATPSGSADYIMIGALFSNLADAGFEQQPWTAILNGFDEGIFRGVVGAGGAGGDTLEVALVFKRGTASGASETLGGTPPATSSGGHVRGVVSFTLNVTAGGGASVTGVTITATASVARVGGVDHGRRLWRRQAVGRIRSTDLYRKTKSQVVASLVTTEFFGATVASGAVSVNGVVITATTAVVNGTAITGVIKGGITLTATASVISGTVAIGKDVSGSTITATASVISGAVTTGTLQAAQTLTSTASVVSGVVTTGALIAAQTLTAVASIIGGSAGAGTSVSGVTITATASIISGAVTTGTLRPAQTLTATASIVSGAVTTGVLIAAQTLTSVASIIAGTVSAGSNVNVNGVTLTATASVLSGAVTTGALRPAQTLTATASIVSGAASGGASRSGVTLTATASIISGTVAAGGDYTFPGATLDASASLIPGSLTLTALLAGVILQANAIIIPATRFGEFYWNSKPDTDNPWTDGGAGSDLWTPKEIAAQPWN